MTLFTKTQLKQLLENGKTGNPGKDHKPVAKLVLPGTPLAFLIIEIDNEQADLAFGLCDLGTGQPELGYVSLNELTGLHAGDGCTVECDPMFKAKHPISVYVNAARYFQAITTDECELQQQFTFPF